MDKPIERTLRAIEQLPDREKLFWNVPRSTGEFLNVLVKIMKAKNVLEIGTSNGYSGIFLAEALRDNNGILWTIESHRERFSMAQQHFEQAGLSPFIVQFLGHAPEIFHDFFGKKKDQVAKTFAETSPEIIPNFFDLIFIDATKGEYASYAEVLIDHIAVGGLVVADNALSHADALQDYFKALQALPQLQNVLLPFDNGLMLSYKK